MAVATGIFSIGGHLWIHEPVDLADYLALPWTSSDRDHETPAAVRTYGSGEIAVVRTFGTHHTRSYQLLAINEMIVDGLEHRSGRVQLFRDAEGRAYHGVYTTVSVRYQAPMSIDATITVTEVGVHLAGAM